MVFKKNFRQRKAGILLVIIGFFLSTIFFSIQLSNHSVSANNGYVVDNDDYLSTKTEKYIEQLNKESLAQLENHPQYMVEVVNELPDDQDIDEFRNEEFRRLGVGQKEYDNGVLLVLAVNDHKYGVEVGYGLEGVIPDGSKSYIVDRKVVSFLRAGNYDAAVLRISKRLNHLLGEGLNSVEMVSNWFSSINWYNLLIFSIRWYWIVIPLLLFLFHWILYVIKQSIWKIQALFAIYQAEITSESKIRYVYLQNGEIKHNKKRRALFKMLTERAVYKGKKVRLKISQDRVYRLSHKLELENQVAQRVSDEARLLKILSSSEFKNLITKAKPDIADFIIETEQQEAIKNARYDANFKNGFKVIDDYLVKTVLTEAIEPRKKLLRSLMYYHMTRGIDLTTELHNYSWDRKNMQKHFKYALQTLSEIPKKFDQEAFEHLASGRMLKKDFSMDTDYLFTPTLAYVSFDDLNDTFDGGDFIGGGSAGGGGSSGGGGFSGGW